METGYIGMWLYVNKDRSLEEVEIIGVSPRTQMKAEEKKLGLAKEYISFIRPLKCRVVHFEFAFY